MSQRVSIYGLANVLPLKEAFKLKKGSRFMN